MPQDTELTYKGGFSKLIPGEGGQQAAAFDGMQRLLEDLTAAGLETLASRLTNAPETVCESPKTALEKWHQLCGEMAGMPQLVTLHALVIAASRRRDPPKLAQQLFLQMWRENAAVLLPYLDLRWRLSAVLTFQIFGETEAQRLAAAQINVMFSMMKLYETERMFSGFSPEEPYRIRRKSKAALPFGMTAYSLRGGDLDRNLLGRLWLDAEADPLLRPLTCGLLSEVNRDKGGIFRRLVVMKRQRRQQREARKNGEN